MSESTLALRLAAPLQSWGATSQYNRRDTQDRPTFAGVLGLLAAAEGRRRGDPIEDLLGLRFGVRLDQPGSLLRDYHTVSDFRGVPLLSASVNAKGIQKPAGRKMTHVTQRYYLQDAVFVALIQGEGELVSALAHAVRHPKFPLALGRRSCVPSQPILLANDDDPIREGSLVDLLQGIPWQAGLAGRARAGVQVRVAATVDDPDGHDLVADVPLSFDQRNRAYTSRRVRHLWVDLPTGSDVASSPAVHDPFALLED